MNKYRLKNGVVKLSSALKYTETDLSIGTDTSQFICSNWNIRNLLAALNLKLKASASIYTMEECHGSLASTIP